MLLLKELALQVNNLQTSCKLWLQIGQVQTLDPLDQEQIWTSRHRLWEDLELTIKYKQQILPRNLNKTWSKLLQEKSIKSMVLTFLANMMQE